MEQRTEEWFKARLGKLTASRFDDIVKKDGTLRTGERPNNYMNEKIFELLNNKPFEFQANTAMQWGTDNEEAARIAYEDCTFESVDEVGFVTHWIYEYIGCSSDGLIGKEGGIEIKCPFNSCNHINTLVSNEIPAKYKAQVQGNIWINGLKWMDFVSYDPRMDTEDTAIKIIRCPEDADYIRNLHESLDSFWEEILAKMSTIQNTTYKQGQE